MISKFQAEDFLTSASVHDYLGSGSFASVRICSHPTLGNVVVKCFRLTGSKEAYFHIIKDAKMEANVHCRLQHKNIIRCFGTTQWSNYYGLVMEKGLRYNMEDLLIHQQDKSISWPVRLKFSLDIAQGLEYLHYHNPICAYIHGDLKSQNILFDGNLVAKIADFGAVSIINPSSTTASLEFESTKQLSVLYSAPELLKNPSMKRTIFMDVYSYAMIIYEIITRRTVFYQNVTVPYSLITVLIIENGQKPDLALVDEACNLLTSDKHLEIFELLKKVMMQCWDYNPINRCSMKSVKQLLEDVSVNEPYDIEHLKENFKHSEANDKVSLLKFEHSFIALSSLGTAKQPQSSDNEKFEDGSEQTTLQLQTKVGKEKFDKDKAVTDVKWFLMKEAFRKKDTSLPRYFRKSFDLFKSQLDDDWLDSYSHECLHPSANVSIESILSQKQDDKTKLILLTGSCESGEASLTSCLLQKYLNKKALFGAQCIFYIRFANIDLDFESTLLEFLIPTFTSPWIINSDISGKVLEHINLNEKVCVILDNLSFSNLRFSEEVFEVSKYNTKSFGKVHLKNLLYGNALPGATVLATIKPSQMLLLPTNIKPDIIINILGLDQKALQKATKNVYGESSHAICRYIEGYPKLYQFCVTLSNHFAVTHMINRIISSKQIDEPFFCFPLSQVFLPSLALVALNKNNVQGQCNLLCVVKCVWQCFSQTTHVINKIPEKEIYFCPMIDVFLQLRPPKYFHNKFDVCFYEICQDCFTAMYLLFVNQENDKDFNEYLDCQLKPQLINGRMQNREVTKFLFGLCNKFVFDYIKLLLPSCTFPTRRSTKLSDYSMNILTTESTDHCKSYATLLFASSLAFEKQCDDFSGKLANNFPEIICVTDECCTSEIVAFIYALQKRTTELHVNNISSLNEVSRNIFINAKNLSDYIIMKI